jgi:acetyltransferase-like isoleucine patch superfamily enzyme
MKSITIKEDVTIGDGCLLLDSNIHDFTPGGWYNTPKSASITIEARPHLAPDVTVLKGVTIGADSLVGNRSVVQRSVPSRSVVVGNPGRVVLRYAAAPVKSQG